MEKRRYQTKPSPQNVPKKNQGTFTHFVSVPLIHPEISKQLRELQNNILNEMTEIQKSIVTPNNPDLFHITLSMLALPKQDQQEKASSEFFNIGKDIAELHGGNIKVNLKNLGCFKKPFKNSPGTDEFDEVSLIYLNILEDEYYTKLQTTCNIIIRRFLQEEIIHEDDLKSMNIIFKNGTFKPEALHITLFRVKEQSYKDESGKYVKYNWRNIFEKYGSCDLGKTEIPHIDISTRFSYEKDNFYKPLALLDLNNIKQEGKSEDTQTKP